MLGAFKTVTFIVELIKKLRKAVLDLCSVFLTVLLYLKKREINRLARFVLEHKRSALLIYNSISELVERSGKKIKFLFTDLVGIKLAVFTAKLTAGQGRRALQGAKYRRGKSFVRVCLYLSNDVFCRVIGYVQLALRRRCNVFKAGKYLPDSGLAEIDSLDSVNDLSVTVKKNDVAVLCHYFNGEYELDFVADLVRGIKIKVEYSVKSRLTDIDKLSVEKFFSHQHTKHRRHGGIFGCVFSQMYSRTVAPDGKKKLPCACFSAQVYNQLLTGGLVHLFNTAEADFSDKLVFNFT